MRFLDRRVHLITGKGGVGRTTVAAAAAMAAAHHGKRVLLCEIGDPEGGYSAIGRRFGHETLSETPCPLAPGVLGCHLWAPTGHESFLRSVLPAGPLIRAALRSKALTKFLSAAPSFHEMGIFQHLLDLLRHKRKDGSPAHEVVIVDMPATGHTLALTGLPDILLKLIPGGPMVRNLKEGQAILNDPRQTAAWVVTLPEQLPVSEALELLEGLAATKMTAGGVILNRYPLDPFTTEEHAALEACFAEQPVHGELAFRRLGTAQAAADRLHASTDALVVELPDVHEAPESVLAEVLVQAMVAS